MSDTFIFEKLEVYKKAIDFAVEVGEIISKIPYKFSRISSQFIGAAISISLNIAEGNGRGSSKEKINFYKIARSSSFECIPIIEICFKLKLIDKELSLKLKSEIVVISSMLSGLISYQRSRV